MVDLTDRGQLIEQLKKRGLWLRKESGQHFLIDQTVLTQIIEAAELNSMDKIVEVGPGIGTLTAALAQALPDGLILAVEKDPRLVATLRDDFKSRKNVKIVHADGVRFVKEMENDESRIQNDQWKLIANLPYNITGQILRQIFEPKSAAADPVRLVLMLQKEVVSRLLAEPGSSKRGILTIAREVGWEAHPVVDVPAEAFFPVPKVDSAVILMVPRVDAYSLDLRRRILHLAKLGFAAKRRTIENTLSAGLYLPKQQVAVRLTKVGIEPRLRAEDLTLAHWQAVAVEFTASGQIESTA